MTKPIFLTLLWLTGSTISTPAAPPVGRTTVKQTTVGDVTIDWGAATIVVGNYFNFSGGIHAVSKEYDLQAEAMKFDTAADGKSIARAVATGTASKQIIGKLTQATEQGTRQTFVYADRAVYKPDASRPAGGQIDFTGHVTIRVIDPQALVGPGLAAAEALTVVLGRNTPGQKPDYPRLEIGEVKAKLTPKPEDAAPK